MINLKVPLVKQKTKHDCSVACGLMVLQFFGKNVDYSKFNVRRDKQKKINIFDLAICLKKFGLSPQLIFFNFLKPKSNFVTNSIKRANLLGIKIKHKIFSAKDIENLLLNKKPVITLVSVAEFRQVMLPKWKGHFIVITGFDKNYFYYNDPHWENKKFGKHKIKKEILIAAIYRTNFPAILWAKSLKNSF